MPRRPRIVVAVTDAQSAGLVIGQLADLKRRGADAYFLSSPGPAATRLCETEDVEHLAVPMLRAPAPREDLRSLAQLVMTLRRIRPDVVNAGTPKAALLVTAAAAAIGVPCRVHTLHGLRFANLHGVGGTAVRLSQQAACFGSHVTLCVSASLRARALERRLAPEHKLVVLGAGSNNGVDLDWLTRTTALDAVSRKLRAELAIPEDAAVVGFVGRLAADKGVAELTGAWRQLRAVANRHLVLVGAEDPTDPVPRRILEELRADPRVHLTGARSDLPAVFGCMDLFVLPTHREGLGNVLIEAAAMGLPVVSTAIDGCVDAVADGVTGTLVEPGRVDPLVTATERYLRDPGLRAAHGHAGRERVKRLFDRRVVLATLAEFYGQMLADRALPALA